MNQTKQTLNGVNALYLAGPIAGCEDRNKPLFERVALRIQSRFYVDTLNPHRVGPHPHPGRPCPNGYMPVVRDLASGAHGAACHLRSDLREMLAAADGIVLLPGWIHSQGVWIELTVARAVGLRLFEYNEIGTDDAHEWSLSEFYRTVR